MTDGSMQAPGWYYAEGDPPGTQRYWDGAQWQGGPQPVAGAGGVAAAAGSNLASPWNRLGARIIDFFVLLIPLLIVSLIFGAGAFGLGGGEASFLLQFVAGIFTTLITLAYEFFFLSQKNGQTIGKKALNVRVQYEDGRALDQDGTIRRLILPALQVIPILGGLIGLVVGLATIIMIFVDEKKQVPHDKIAKTVVVTA